MRNMIGKDISVYVEDEGEITGKMVGDDRSFINIRLENGKVKRVVKSKVCSWMPVDDDVDGEFIPFHMLFCENKITGCSGVQFIQEGEGVAVKDFEKFMGKCPCRDDCTFGTKGELRSVDGAYLRDVIGNTMFGSYPEKKEESGDE